MTFFSKPTYTTRVSFVRPKVNSTFGFYKRSTYCTFIQHFQPKISVIGVGGAGGNAVNHMICHGLEGVDFLVCNTDAQALSQSPTHNRIQLGKDITKGLGAGAQRDVGKQAAESDVEHILTHPSVINSHLVFIAAGMGGGTGTGAAPVIAKALQQKGILTVAVVTSPFQFEGKVRSRNAHIGIHELSGSCDTMIIINNQKLLELAKEERKMTMASAFNASNDVLYLGVKTISDLIVKPGLINLDYSDVRTVLLSSKNGDQSGKALMGTGISSGEHRARRAAENAINNRLLDENSLQGARGMLINISGGEDLTMSEVEEATNFIQEHAHHDAYIVWGAAQSEELNGKISVSVVATGLGLDD